MRALASFGECDPCSMTHESGNSITLSVFVIAKSSLILKTLLPGLGHHLPVQLQLQLDWIDELKKKLTKIEEKSEKSNEKSKDSSDDAADSEERALEVEKVVEDAIKRARDAVNSAQMKAGEIGKNGDTDLKDLLKKARKIVRELEGRDFIDPESYAENELRNAI
ncbi:uncharacterized protein [Ptychodera flava]|uniref:uncharacterized protein n=1 Tax=Ptychodera flava TaxID=63121 RepID=UPI00396A9AD5